MRHGQNSRRSRGRNNSNANGNNNRRSSLPNRNQTFDSNGPEVRIRGNAYQVHEKYLALARDAAASGDRVMSENYMQHAEHYFRIIQSMNEAYAQAQQHDSGGRDQPREVREPNGSGDQPSRNNANGSQRPAAAPAEAQAEVTNGRSMEFGVDPRSDEDDVGLGGTAEPVTLLSETSGGETAAKAGDATVTVNGAAEPEAVAAAEPPAEPPKPRRRRAPRMKRTAEPTAEAPAETSDNSGE